jgi:predicted DNA binding protein
MGYYKRPREASLEEIADELDISQQARSQRLGAVEEKLITQLFTSE